MSPRASIGLPEALERAASALPSHAERIRPANGDPSQLARGLDADAATRVLEWLLVHEPEAGAELVGSWAEDPETGAEPLRRLDASHLPKAGAKALRRARHRLRSSGIALPEEPPVEVVVKLPPVEDALSAALVSPVDPRGTRVVYLAESHPSGGARLFELMLDEERGVVEFEVYSAGRSKVRKFLRDFTQRRRFAGVEAPPAAVRALVARIASEQPADRPLPRGFTEWRARVATPEADAAATPGELARAELGAEGGEGDATRAAELVRERELGPWPPAGEALQRIAERLGEAGKGRIIVPGARRRGQVAQLFDGALVELFGERFALHTAQRFEESAYTFWKRGVAGDARACLAAAVAFRERAPTDNPVARAMFEVWLGPVLSKLEEETSEQEKDSLLVKP